jgi:hypothetical protein
VASAAGNKATAQVLVGRLLDSSTKKSQTVNRFGKNGSERQRACGDHQNVPTRAAYAMGIGLGRALSRPPGRFPPCRSVIHKSAGFALICLPRLGIGDGNFQPIEYVPYPLKKFLDHEGRLDTRQRDLLDCVKVQGQVGGRRMGVDDRDAKTDKRMHLAGEEAYVFGFPGIRHQSLP